jgi:ribonuclease PH
MTERNDGRKPDELRPINIQLGFLETAEGSCWIEFGKTKILCTASFSDSVPKWIDDDKGWVTAEYAMLPGSTDTRNDRESTRGKVSGRTQEISRLIGRSLRAVADLSALGERTLWVDCDVLQADGGTRTASITGAYTALALACGRLQRRGDVDRNPLRDSVAAISVGVIDGEVRLDLPYEEDARADVDMNVVATGKGRFIEVQGTGEGTTFSADELRSLTDLALGGIEELGRIQQAALTAAESR